MFKVTFAFENGSTVEAFANAGDNLLEDPVLAVRAFSLWERFWLIQD